MKDDWYYRSIMSKGGTLYETKVEKNWGQIMQSLVCYDKEFEFYLK